MSTSSEHATTKDTRVPATARRTMGELEHQPVMPAVVSVRIASVSNVVIIDDTAVLTGDSPFVSHEGADASQPSVSHTSHASLSDDSDDDKDGKEHGHRSHHHGHHGHHLIPLHGISGHVRPRFCVVRVSLQGAVAETRGFPPPLFSLAESGDATVKIGDNIRMPGRILPDARSPANLLSFELMLFSHAAADARDGFDPSLGTVVGSVHLHLHDLARVQRVSSVEVSFFSGDAVVGRMRLSATFSYGTFGYGHGTVLGSSKRESIRSVSHSLYPRIRPPRGRLDPVHMTAAPTVQRMPSLLYTRPTLLGLHRELGRLRAEELAAEEAVERGVRAQKRVEGVGAPAATAAPYQDVAGGLAPMPVLHGSETDSQTSAGGRNQPATPATGSGAGSGAGAAAGVDVARATAILGYTEGGSESEGDDALSRDDDESLHFGDVVLPDDELMRLFVRDMHSETPLAATKLDPLLRRGRGVLNDLAATPHIMPGGVAASTRQRRLDFLWGHVNDVTTARGAPVPQARPSAGAAVGVGEGARGWRSYMKPATG